MQYFRLSFDDNNDGIYETDITFTINPQDYTPFAGKSRVVSIPLLNGSAIQDSGLFFEGSVIEMSNAYIQKADFETLYKRYNCFIRDKQARVTGVNEYTLQDSNSALEKPTVLKGADATDDTSLMVLDDSEVIWSSDTPTKVTVTALAGDAYVYFYYRIARGNCILTDNNNEQWLVAWDLAQFDPRITPLSTYRWNFRFICIKKLYGSSINQT